jgi:hypothetical protein
LVQLKAPSPQLPTEEGWHLSLHLSPLRSPVFARGYEPHVCEMKNKSDFFLEIILQHPSTPRLSLLACTLT